MDREQGFTVLEVLVAFAILAAALSVFVEAFGGGLRGIERAERVELALAHARSKLAELHVQELKPGESRGRFDGDFAWHVRVDRHGDRAVADAPLVTHDLTVSVMWREGLRERTISIPTLHLGPRRDDAQ